MSDVAHLIQDLLAEAHRAPADCAELMRRAAAELKGITGDAVAIRFRGSDMLAGLSLVDADPSPPPFPPPAIEPRDVRVKGRPAR